MFCTQKDAIWGLFGAKMPLSSPTSTCSEVMAIRPLGPQFVAPFVGNKYTHIWGVVAHFGTHTLGKSYFDFFAGTELVVELYYILVQFFWPQKLYCSGPYSLPTCLLINNSF